MRFHAMAKQFLFEAALEAAKSASSPDGRFLELGRDFTEAETKSFRAALLSELRSQQRLLVNNGVLDSGNLLVRLDG